jgi:hypothetical protein
MGALFVDVGSADRAMRVLRGALRLCGSGSARDVAGTLAVLPLLACTGGGDKDKDKDKDKDRAKASDHGDDTESGPSSSRKRKGSAAPAADPQAITRAVAEADARHAAAAATIAVPWSGASAAKDGATATAGANATAGAKDSATTGAEASASTGAEAWPIARSIASAGRDAARAAMAVARKGTAMTPARKRRRLSAPLVASPGDAVKIFRRDDGGL